MRPALAVLIFGGSLAQTNLVPAFWIAPVTPDVPLILTVFLGLRRGSEVGCLAGFAMGIIQDAAAGGQIGAQALTKALAGFGVGLLGRRFWVHNPTVQVAGLVLLTLAEGIARFALLQLFRFPAPLSEVVRDVILPQALYNGFLGSALALVLALAEARRSD
jgi:rod shape-determining protein MreD